MTHGALARSDSSGLDANGLLASDNWLDRPDAAEEIERRRAAGRITDEEAANLEQFRRDGFFVFRPDIGDELFDLIDRDVDRLWHEQPPWMAYAFHSLLTRFSGGDEVKRRPASRITDLHEFSDSALELYLHPRIFRYVDLILDETGVAIHTLYFQWGSQQALHRDPIHVRMSPPAALTAAWIALEDIRPGCGELYYVPGSHRMPYFEFEPGRFVFDHAKDPPGRAREAEAWDLERCAEKGLEAVPLRCRRGDCLIWHHSLLHGGGELVDETLTRKSLVVHYTTLAGMPSTQNRYLDPYLPPNQDGSLQEAVYESDRLHRMRGCRGFASPLVERFREEARSFHQGTYARRVAELEATLATREQEIAAMKSSRFWKLRDAWWKLRRSIGSGS